MRRRRDRIAIANLAVSIACLAAASAAGAGAITAPYVVEVDLTADIRALGSDDPFVSEPAVEHLVALGPVTLPALAKAYRQESPEVRAGVVDVVRQLDDAAAVALLVEAAGDRDGAVRADALMAIGLGRETAGSAAVEAALRDPDPRARRSAILACGQVCTSPEALARLVDLALGDGEAMAMAMAARQSLASAVTDGDAARAERARAAIATRTVPALSAPEPARRLDAALTAALIGEPRSVPILAEALRDGPPALAPLAALALGGVPTPEAVAVLDRTARGDARGLANAACIGLQSLQARAVPGADAALTACPKSVPPTPQP